MAITTTEISIRRKKLRNLLDRIEGLTFFGAHQDPLIQGAASKVYRRCGNKNCKCLSDENRHGPYMVIQLYENKKQRQVSVNENQQDYWHQANNYQKQIKSLLKLKKSCNELVNEVETIIQKRLTPWEY